MERIKVSIERTESDGKPKVIDTFVYDLPMSAEQTADVGAAVTDRLEKLSAQVAARGG